MNGANYVKMWDASTPDFEPPHWLKIVSGYVGGDTPHVWTSAQWARFDGIKKLPIFVTTTTGVPSAWTDAWYILQLLYRLGVPKLTAVVLDLETRIDPAYVTGVHRIIHDFGYLLWPYGSVGTLFANPVCDGYFVATLDGIAQPVMHPGVKATQYVDRGQEDTSLVEFAAYHNELAEW